MILIVSVGPDGSVRACEWASAAQADRLMASVATETAPMRAKGYMVRIGKRRCGAMMVGVEDSLMTTRRATACTALVPGAAHRSTRIPGRQ